MNYGATQYSLKDRAYDIFLSGCDAPHCEGCHNPDLWDFKIGKDLDAVEMVERIGSASYEMIDKIRIMGGEPFDQPLGDLNYLLDILRHMCPEKEIWIFTRYYYWQLNAAQRKSLRYVDYVKHGRYDHKLPPKVCRITGLKLASGNQYVREYVGGNFIPRPQEGNQGSPPTSQFMVSPCRTTPPHHSSQ